jgi:phage shock protein C
MCPSRPSPGLAGEKSMTGLNAPLRRPRRHRVIAGVVAGLADYFGIDITLARVLYVILSVCSAAFPGVLVYVLFWIFTPQEEEPIAHRPIA